MESPMRLRAAPLVFRAGTQAPVTLTAEAAAGVPAPGGRFRLSVEAAEGVAGSLRHPGRREIGRLGVGESVAVPCAFPSEQEYVFRLEDDSGGKSSTVAEARVYAARPDLFARRPWKGDLHMHSKRSDGQDEPAEVLAACRRVGMDFAALTDHRAYEPSLDAIRTFQGCPTDLVMLPGEEVHPPECPVHIVNAGGSRSINAAFAHDEYRREVEALARAERALAAVAPEDRYQYAAAFWCFRRIRESGGLGIFCHPSWISGGRYDVPAALTDLIFALQPYDALELIGGYQLDEAESNAHQVARWAEERAAGRRIPVVGVSDAHGCFNGRLFGWYYTIVFAPSPAWAEVLDAIRLEWSVAVEARPGEVPRVFGPDRLVKFSYFLMHELMVRHDELCAEEGELLLAWARGERSAVERLAGLRGRVAALHGASWARG